MCVTGNISHIFYKCHINTADVGLCGKMGGWPSRCVYHDKKNAPSHEVQEMGWDL